MTEKRYKHTEIKQDDGQTICYGIEDTTTRYVHNVVGEGMYDIAEEQLIDKLNWQDHKIKDLQERNNSQAERLKEVGDLIMARDWEELEKKAIEMEENEKLLQKEYGDVE